MAWVDIDIMRFRDSQQVFITINDTPIKCFNKDWWRVLGIAVIKDFHFHDFRNTFCSNLILSGVSLKDAKELIGHEDIAMTDRYSHLRLQHHLSKQEQLTEHYDNAKIRGWARYRLDRRLLGIIKAVWLFR